MNLDSFGYYKPVSRKIEILTFSNRLASAFFVAGLGMLFTIIGVALAYVIPAE